MTTRMSRRHFLAGVSATTLFPTRLPGQEETPKTPDESLHRLVEGNRRFAADQFTSIPRDLKLLKEHTVEKQEPFAAVLSCADSRVPVELVFDQTIGDLFVCRVAGNIINAEIIGSLEYGAAVLGVKLLVVMGHANCGAVKAALTKKAVPGQIASLYPHLEQAVQMGAGDLKNTICQNARLQAELLSKTSTVLAPMVAKGKLKVRAAYYDVGDGTVTLL